MTDDLFIRMFESFSLPAESFHHSDHVRLAWLYLQDNDVLSALTRFARGLKAFAGYHGKADRYHETITYALFFIINERVARMGRQHTWGDFESVNGDLLAWPNSVLKGYYREETLSSGMARSCFVFPDRSDVTGLRKE